jgi:hypothetical protein
MRDVDHTPPSGPTISLWNLDQPALLLEAPTGVAYHGQVGGVACLHPWVEGFVVPLDPSPWGSLQGSCAVVCTRMQDGSLDPTARRWIARRWPRPPEHAPLWWLEFDDVRADETTEAWFPVRVTLREDLIAARLADRATWLPPGLADDDGEMRTARALAGKTGYLLLPDNCD